MSACGLSVNLQRLNVSTPSLIVPLYCLSYYLSFPFLCHCLAGRGGAVGAGILGALLPGDVGGGGPGLVHPFARPQQPGGGAAAAAAQRPVGQRSPQQPGGSGGESDASDCAALTLSVLDKMSNFILFPSLCRGRAS